MANALMRRGRGGDDALKAGFDLLLATVEKLKLSWTPPIIKELEESIKVAMVQCQGVKLYFLKPTFKSVLESVYTVLETIWSKKDPANPHCYDTIQTTVFGFFTFLCKEESVRKALRDDYKLLYILSEFFLPNLNPEEMYLILSLIEIVSRDLSISWKSPQLKLLVKNVYIFVSQNPTPGQNLSLALQFLVNICLENSSCALMARFDENHKAVMKLLQGLWKGQENHTFELLCTHLIYLYEPTLPSEKMKIGIRLISTCLMATTECYKKNTRGSTPHVDLVITSFNLMKDFMKTFTTKIESIVTSSSGVSGSPVEVVVLPADKERIITESTDKFLIFATEVLTQLGNFVSTEGNINPQVGEALLKFALTFLPSSISVSENLDSHKRVLKIIQLLVTDVEKGSSLHLSCLRAYFDLIEQVLKHRRDGRQTVFEKLGFEDHLSFLVKNLRIYDNVTPSGTQVNIYTFRLIRCFSYCGDKVAGESGKKLDLDIIRSLVGNLTEEKTVLENIRWEETVCLIELLVTMSKYSSNPQILNTLLAFVTTDKISQHIANCVLYGDSKTVKNALAVITAIAFQDNALLCVSESLLRCRMNPSEAKPSNTDLPDTELGLYASNGAISLQQTLCSFSTVNQDGVGFRPEPDRGDVLTLLKIKQEMHEFELASLYEQIKHLQKINAQLKLYMARQSELLAGESCHNENEKIDQLQLENLAVAKQKDFNTKISALQKEIVEVNQQLRKKEERAEELQKLLVAERAEKAELVEKLSNEEKARGEALQKIKALREETKTLRGEVQKNSKQLTESNAKVARLEDCLRQKEDEAVQNRVLFDNERRLMDTIRGVIGNNFASGMNGKGN